MEALSRRATASVTSFSSVPDGPRVPASSPPWPGSITMVRMAGRRAVRLGNGSPPGTGAGVAVEFGGGVGTGGAAVTSGAGSRSTTIRLDWGVDVDRDDRYEPKR